MVHWMILIDCNCLGYLANLVKGGIPIKQIQRFVSWIITDRSGMLLIIDIVCLVS